MVLSTGLKSPSFLLICLCYVALVQSQISFNDGPGRPGGVVRYPLFNQTPRSHKPTNEDRNQLSGCNCVAASNCPRGFGQLKTSCILKNERDGICCIPQERVVLTRVGFIDSQSMPRALDKSSIVNGVKNGQKVLKQIKTDEQKRLRNKEFLSRGSPDRGHAFFFQRRKSSRELHKAAYLIAQSSVSIAKSESLTPQQAFFGLPDYRVGVELRTFQCPSDRTPTCRRDEKFRSIDGTCNNLQNPNFGKSKTGFGRLSPPIYNDGIMEPRTMGVHGMELPNVREASKKIPLHVDIPDAQFTLNVMQWAQFIDHDLTHTPFADMDGVAIRCCEDGRLVDPQPSECFPIIISPSPFNGFYGRRGQRCLNFVRSMLALNENCSFGPVEQMNTLTHWLDGSMIYGSSDEEKEMVVDSRTGLLRHTDFNLPATNSSIDCEARIPNTPCYVAGDSRITHVVWVREHNRIANHLKRLNPRISPFDLFEETRRIVIAEVQHITYKEWLPIIIGESTMKFLGINTLSSGFRNNYDHNLDPAINNEFATAAFRFGHSLVQGIFGLWSETGRQSSIQLHDAFNATHILMTQKIRSFDNFVSRENNNHHFQTPRFPFGLDLMSLNIQRGRDHAIGTYNQLRPLFGLARAYSFHDLMATTSKSLIIRIQTVYRSVDDIDLFVGGMTEKHLPDALLGPLFSRIIGKQFQKLMTADRFFYDLRGQPGSFSSRQLQEIRKSSMAKLFCDNTEVGVMQPLSFRAQSRSNPLKPCEEIPGMDLSLFS